MTTPRKLQYIALTIMVVGLALGAPLAYYWSQQKVAVAQGQGIALPAVAPLPPAQPELLTGKPVRLQIPALSMDLQVTDGSYNENTGAWTLSNDRAHYALPSTQPNNLAGSTLIYGHYRPEVFARLKSVSSGAEAIVTTDTGLRFVYAFELTEKVDPADVSVFAYEGAPRLTLQTCSGAFMQHRQLYYFNFARAEQL